MNCPLMSEQTVDVLLEYSAGRLSQAGTAKLETHMDTCARCAAFRVAQTDLWMALDAWEPQPVSTSFNRRLWKKIDEAAAAPWYRRLAESLRFGAWKPAFPLAAAVVVVAAGFVMDHQGSAVGTAIVGNGHGDATGVSITEADQVERTLDDIQLLRQFDAAAGGTNGNSSRPL